MSAPGHPTLAETIGEKTGVLITAGIGGALLSPVLPWPLWTCIGAACGLVFMRAALYGKRHEGTPHGK